MITITGAEAGPDLDRQIAEEVLDWGDWWYWDEGRVWYGHPPNATIEDDRVPVPPFSTDLRAAWQVVEHMATRQWEASLTRWVAQPEIPDHIGCLFERNDPETGEWLESREAGAAVDAPALAICRAALAVVRPPPKRSQRPGVPKGAGR